VVILKRFLEKMGKKIVFAKNKNLRKKERCLKVRFYRGFKVVFNIDKKLYISLDN